MSTSSRLAWVDYAKGIGILLVVYGHVARGIYNAGIPFNESLYRVVDSIIYSFHMPLFFFLSGLFFVSSFEKKGTKKLILSKIDTIVYPFILWSLLQGGIELVLSSQTNGSISASEVINLWVPRAQFWFLYALFFIFAVTTILYMLVKKNVLVICMISVALFLLPVIISGVPATVFVSNYLVFFVLGVALQKYGGNLLLVPNHPLIFGVSILCLCFGLQYFAHFELEYNYIQGGPLGMALAVLSILSVCYLSKLFALLNYRLLALIGGYSMAIYLMHILAGSGVRIVLDKILGQQSLIIHLVAGLWRVATLAPIIAALIAVKMKVKFVFSAPISNFLLKVQK